MKLTDLKMVTFSCFSAHISGSKVTRTEKLPSIKLLEILII